MLFIPAQSALLRADTVTAVTEVTLRLLLIEALAASQNCG